MDEIQVEKTYWASVSGGKDSLKMLHIILENPQKYPLNGIVHWKLEIDYDFYKVNRRQGCKYCPNISRIELAYLHEKYPNDFEFLIQKIREYEAKYKRPWTNDTQYIDNVLEHVYKKWLPLLHERLKGE